MKILIADDHTLFREGIRHVLARLADDAQILEAGDCAQALKAVEDNTDIALVLLDLHMPGRDGFAALDTLSRKCPALPIVVLSGSESNAEMRRALDNGAMGFIPKSATAQVMLSALRLVLSGGVYVPPALIQSDPSARAPALTPRQIDVLRRVIEGKPNKIIASELALTEATVKAHISAVFKALDVTNRTQAARAAERMGLKLSRTC